MKKYLVIGLGRFGISMAMTLSEEKCEVMVLDKNEEAVMQVRDEVTYALVGDCTDSIVLEQIGVRNFDAVIVGIGDSLETSIMTTAILKELGARYIIAKAQNTRHETVLLKVGADKVVRPERDMGIRLARMLTTETFVDYIELSPTHSIVEMKVPSAWVGKSIITLDVRRKFHINILAVKKQNGEIDALPMGDTVFEDKDVIVILGEKDTLEKL